jgi:hypothetical protein
MTHHTQVILRQLYRLHGLPSASAASRRLYRLPVDGKPLVEPVNPYSCAISPAANNSEQNDSLHGSVKDGGPPTLLALAHEVIE